MPSSDPNAEIALQDAAVGRDWQWLTGALPMTMAQNGDIFRGFSVCPKVNQWLMTVRVTIEGVAQVAFTCTGTPSACVASFRKRWDDETLQFFPDRYV